MSEIEVVQKSVSPFSNSIIPTIQIAFVIKLASRALLITATGSVYSEDGKRISNLVPHQLPYSDISISDISTLQNTQTQEKKPLQLTMLFSLDREALDHIENVRFKNKKRDVVFRFDVKPIILYYTVLRSQERGEIKKAEIEKNVAIVPESHLSLEYTIPASDWVNDFQIPLGIGKFLIVEIPQLESEKLPNIELREEAKILVQALNEATKYLQAIEGNLRQGNWNEVVKDSRLLLELFRKTKVTTDNPQNIKEVIKDILIRTTGLQPSDASSLTEAIDKFSIYTGALHHSVDQSGQIKETIFTGDKEDAYFAYMFSFGLVNLLHRKLKKYLEEQRTITQ